MTVITRDPPDQLSVPEQVEAILAREPSDAEIEKQIRAAIRKRDRGQRLIDEGNAQLAAWSAVARQTEGAITTSRLAEIAELSREYLYKIQRAHGVGA